MGYSFYEIYTTSQRAFRGMGFPFGADEDAAYIIAWLELNNFNGVDICERIVKQIDQHYDGVINYKEIKETLDFKKKSILMKGPGFIDFIQSNIFKDNTISINVSNCVNGILFLPLLYKANKEIAYLELIYTNSKKKINIFKIHNNKIFYKVQESAIKEDEVKITLSNKKIDDINNSYEEIINEKIIQKNLSNSLTPDEQNWDKISNIANRIFVPESEESRNRGAGGGDAND